MPDFDNRSKGMGIFRVAIYKPGKVLIDFPIEESEDVILHSGNYSVIVRNVQKESEGKFKGIVLGIELPGTKLDDIKAGDIVTFSEDQIISASKRE
ncbi:MAG: hypothetical protein L6290_12045 [Thermodesulfovibrionales bacterium]|nr:hypothetical protein [Thermodesulfovibrionales bacterium]